MAEHWLVDVARRAMLADADSLTIDPNVPAVDAWLAAAAHCGLSVDELALEVADCLHLPVARIDRRDPHVARLVPEKFARRYHVVPMRETNRQIVVATDDPLNDEIERGVAFAAGRMPLFEIATPDEIKAALARMFEPQAETPHAIERAEMTFGAEPGRFVRAVDLELGYAPGRSATSPPGGPNAPAAAPRHDPTLLQLVQRLSLTSPSGAPETDPAEVLARRILEQAVRDGAAEVHFDHVHGGGSVRQRLDGIMHVQLRLPLQPFDRLLACVKRLAGIDPAVRLRARHGRVTLLVAGAPVDLIVAVQPFNDAEKLIVSLPDQGAHLTLAGLGMQDRDQRAVRAMLEGGNGIVLVAGPTGSGTTSTLYALIAELRARPSRAITIEDPIDVRLQGVEQVQIEAPQGITFSSALRDALKRDPDVVMVGDLRDTETARLAVQASMTGHLVVAGLHTDDAAMALARLIDMGLDRRAIAASVRGVIAQRLLRQVCPQCAEPVTAPNEAEQRLVRMFGVTPPNRARGCAACGDTGYRGRVAVFEVLTMSPALRELVSSGATTVELRTMIADSGTRTLQAAALQRVVEGTTTLQEIERVVSGRPAEAAGRSGVPRVLVVDDEPVCRLVARQQLEANGFDVIECATGEDALVRLRVDDHVSLVVLDLGLPGLQGGDVLRELRLSPATASLPVVVLTGSPDPDLEVRLMEQGADDYLHKPLEPRRFITRIRAALRRAAA